MDNTNYFTSGGRSLKSRIGWLKENSTMSDLTFIVGEENKEFPAHKFIFAVSSHDFYNGFYAMTPSDNIIRLPEIKIDAFSEFLSYIYTEDANVDSGNILDIMKLAERYEINHLMNFCYESAIIFIDYEMELFDDLLKFGIKCKDVSVLDTFLGKISKDPLKYLTNDNVRILRREHLKIILEDEDTASSEKELFELAIMWAKHISPDSNKIRTNLGDLLELIRFSTMTTAEFEECVTENDGVLQSKDVIDITLFINKSKEVCKYPIVKRKEVIEVEIQEVNNFYEETDMLIDERELNNAKCVDCTYHFLQFSVKEKCLLEGISFHVNGKIIAEFPISITFSCAGPRVSGQIEKIVSVYKGINTTQSAELIGESIETRRINFNRKILLEPTDIYDVLFQGNGSQNDLNFFKRIILWSKSISNGNIIILNPGTSMICAMHYKRP